MATIPVLYSNSQTEIPTEEMEELTLGGGDRGTSPTVRDMPVETLKTSMSQLSSHLGQILSDVKKVGDFKLQEVTLTVEVSAEGKVILVGKTGIKGGITLKFAP